MTVNFEGKAYKQQKQNNSEHICKGCAFGHGTEHNFELDPCSEFGNLCNVNSNLIFKLIEDGSKANRKQPQR